MSAHRLPPAVERLRGAWVAQAGGAREQALFALLLALIVLGAHVARLGTSAARLGAAIAITLVVAAQLVTAIARRREAASTRLTVQRVLQATDPSLGERALRALALVERTAKDDTQGALELAELHFSRLVGKVSNEAVRSAAVRYGQRFRALSILLLCGAVFAVVMAPRNVLEGLDVLAARGGRAPLPMAWLGYPRVSAFPPTYTRESERTLVFGTSVALPKGTTLTVRGVPLGNRELVVTDGAGSEPFVPDGAGGVVARYVVRAPVTLRVAARFGDVRIEEEEGLGVEVVPDEPPTIELEGAPRTEKLTELERVDVRWVARDDHGLKQVDLVLRSGAREERRVLSRIDGETRVERGGHVVTARDAFLRSMFLPIAITVEAKDNDPLDGPKWSKSAPIVVLPPEVGQPEAERYAALVQVRDRVADLLVWRAGVQGGKPDVLAREAAARIASLASDVAALTSDTYSGLTMPRGLSAFLRAQVDQLQKKRAREPGERAIEDVLVAIDVAVAGAGVRDAVAVAKRLGDVAEEAALGARVAREPEKAQGGVERLDAALVAVERGARHLATLGTLGSDVGAVAIADTARVRRSRDAKDYFHAELAALHLAARLRRPSPSFGSSGGSGHGGGHGQQRGGVESGPGQAPGDGDLPPPSTADRDFDRAAGAVSELAQEHEGALRGVEGALEDARRSEPSEEERREARRHAEEVRRAVAPLPLPGQEFGTPRAGAALAREHGSAAAHALDDFSLESAKESADSALNAIEQAERRLQPDDAIRQELTAAKQALAAASEWARGALAKQRAETEARAQNALRQAGDAERALAERANELGDGAGARDAPLPRDTAERLKRAASAMREASRELAAGHGEQGLSLQREAQRLLEQARPGRSAGADPEDEGQERAAPNPPKRAQGDRGGDAREDVATGGDVPGPDEKARAEEFRRRVLEGLGKEKSERLSPAIRKYAEGLLR